MKNWQQMKDFSYVGIKLTKAKTISEGLTRCKIQKLTRNNPVYEHIKLHQKFKSMEKCSICSISKNQKCNKNLSSFEYKVQKPCKSHLVSRKCKTAVVNDQEPINNMNEFQHRIKSSTQPVINTIFNQTPRERVFKQMSSFNKVVQSFSKNLRKTKSSFFKMASHKNNLQKYFLTEVGELQLEFNQDKGLSINQVKTYQTLLRQSLQRKKEKIKNTQNKVKQFQKDIKFPLTERQTVKIVEVDKLAKSNASKKLQRLITSLYDYKSSINYSNRMKMINSVISK